MEIFINFDSFNKHYNKDTNITGTIVIACNNRYVEFTTLNLNLTVNTNNTLLIHSYS